MASWLIITLVIIIVLFIILFGGFIFFMYKDWNNSFKRDRRSKRRKWNK